MRDPQMGRQLWRNSLQTQKTEKNNESYRISLRYFHAFDSGMGDQEGEPVDRRLDEVDFAEMIDKLINIHNQKVLKSMTMSLIILL